MIKPPKRSPALLRKVFLVFTLIFGIYICSICLKQTSTERTSKYLNIEVIERPCHDHDMERSEIPYVHYPKPITFSRAECSCNPVRFFVILSMQRSGSGWFETLLNSHMNVSSNGEIFCFEDSRQNASSILRTIDTVYNLDFFTSASKNHCSAAVGFKWMLNQGLIQYHEEIAEYFNKKGVSVIFLFRRNLLRRMVSVLSNSYDRYAKPLNGTHKSHVHSPEEADTLAKYKPEINTTLLITDLKTMELEATEALEYFNNTRHMILYYEDIVRNRAKLVEEVLEFLRLPEMDLSSRQIKIHNGPLREHIKNWDDVKRTLSGTTYEKFLRADY